MLESVRARGNIGGSDARERWGEEVRETGGEGEGSGMMEGSKRNMTDGETGDERTTGG